MASTIEIPITRNLESAKQSLTESYLYTIKSIVNILKYVIDGPVNHWNFNSTGDNLTYQIFLYGMISPSFVPWSILRPAAFREETMKYHRPLYVPVEIQTREISMQMSTSERDKCSYNTWHAFYIQRREVMVCLRNQHFPFEFICSFRKHLLDLYLQMI